MPPSTSTSRPTRPGGGSSPAGRADDDPAVIDHRLALDAAEAAPLLELLDRAGLLRRIDGCGTEDEVFARILEALGRE